MLEPLAFETLRQELEAVFAAAHQACGIRMRVSPQEHAEHVNSYTFFMSYEGPIPGAAREVKVDVTRRERLVFPLEQRRVCGYDEYVDLPGDSSLQVYALPEIGAEKIVALEDRARNEPRDLYDVWYLLRGHHLRLEDVVTAVEQKWGFRTAELTVVRDDLAAKENRYRKLWSARLSAQVAELPAFEEVFRTVRRAFRQVGLG